MKTTAIKIIKRDSFVPRGSPPEAETIKSEKQIRRRYRSIVSAWVTEAHEKKRRQISITCAAILAWQDSPQS